MDASTKGKAVAILDEIMGCELAGVMRYTHYSLMVRGPHRMPLVDFMKAQALESLTHAQAAGEILTGLDGHPSLGIPSVDESREHSTSAMIEDSYRHETRALSLYQDLLAVVVDKSVYLEEFARGMIGQEELHTMELKKMMMDFGDVERET